jgi:hypothetical protein
MSPSALDYRPRPGTLARRVATGDHFWCHPSRTTRISMKQKRAHELQKAWAGGPCEHPQLAKVYDLGAHTGNFACVKGGQLFTYREKAELTAARRGA